jgi:hypothetical protein
MRKEACISVYHEVKVKAWNWKKIENKRERAYACQEKSVLEARHEGNITSRVEPTSRP